MRIERDGQLLAEALAATAITLASAGFFGDRLSAVRKMVEQPDDGSGCGCASRSRVHAAAVVVYREGDDGGRRRCVRAVGRLERTGEARVPPCTAPWPRAGLT